MKRIGIKLKRALARKVKTAAKKTALSVAVGTVVSGTRQNILVPAYRNWCMENNKSLLVGILLRKLAGR